MNDVYPCRTHCEDRRLTWSQTSAFMKCPRLHYWEYCERIRPCEDGKARRIGRQLHAGLECWHRTRERERAIRTATQYYHENLPLGDGMAAEAWMIEREIVANLISGYIWRWAEMDAEIEWLAVELPFEVEITNPNGNPIRVFVSAGKIDAIARRSTGQLVVWEIKTTSEHIDTDADYWERLLLDGQISRYYRAARSLGYEVESVVYDVIRKPGIRPSRIPQLDDDGKKIVVNTLTGERLYKKDGTPYESVPRNCDEAVVQTRSETVAEFGERLRADIGKRPEFYYARQEIARIDADLEQAAGEQYELAKIIRECELSGFWPRNSNACMAYGRCPYLSLCLGTHTPEHLPENLHRIASSHPELEPATDEEAEV